MNVGSESGPTGWQDAEVAAASPRDKRLQRRLRRLLEQLSACPGKPVPAALAWKAQLRLHKTYRKLTARGKRSVVASAAVARELLGFIWSIGQRVPLGA